MDSENMTEVIKFRCTPEMKAALDEVARYSITDNISDHLRAALEQYIARESAKLPVMA